MPKLSSFTFENLTGVEATVSLYVNGGRVPLFTTRVAGGKTHTEGGGIADDVKSVKVTAFQTDAPYHGTDEEDLSLAGRPYAGFFESLTTQWNIGSLHGHAAVVY